MACINHNSARSIYIEMFFNEVKLSSGTGFFCESKVGSILFTNRHNVTGRNNDTGNTLSSSCAIPNKLRFTWLSSNGPITQEIDLYEDDDMTVPAWAEHPKFGGRVDVVGLVLEKFKGEFPHYVSPYSSWHKWGVGSLVHVIGFPFSISAEGFAIWATGHIASEPDVDYDGLPVFLIDCRTRQGQSGSQVIAQFNPGDTVKIKGRIYQAQYNMTYFLGIYSGRVNSESDIGKVWKASVIRDIIEFAENELK
ncbi:hypothetical protein [Pseudoalteromonas piscicida]|uniref:hypothetical protein n=1 Tax=Pseudoalteromonas piscicida TaxID=43662 RepID=UPI001C93B715|nr:hypothetical protein [Pseudoalteromonas piscicida]QZO12239.1 hypothetical protein K5642_14155 [Pseudoalteromonas piscicida]